MNDSENKSVVVIGEASGTRLEIVEGALRPTLVVQRRMVGFVIGFFTFFGGLVVTLTLVLYFNLLNLKPEQLPTFLPEAILGPQLDASFIKSNSISDFFQQSTFKIGNRFAELPSVLSKLLTSDDENSDLFLSEADEIANSETDVAASGLPAKQEAPTSAEIDAVAPPIVDADSRPKFDRAGVLADEDSRISDDFLIPPGLEERVGFWFDVYSKYDSNQRIIHHSRFPWIVFKVVDVAPIINAETPRHRWMRNEKADKLVKSETAKIRAALRSVSRKSASKKYNEYEQLVADALSKLKGPLKKEAATAAGEVRVQVGQRNFFQEGLEVSPRYLSGMEDVFRSHKLPIELTRIPFVESSFNKRATSKVGASGVWQFMGNTGRKFMTVNDMIDERRSPYKATEAAARLLKENHLILHRSWPLAVTAWNHGPPGVRKAIATAHAKDLALIIARYHTKSFDFASSNFYSEFLGALYTERYNEEIFGEIKRESPLAPYPVKLARSASTKELIKKSGLGSEQFTLLNPDLQTAVARNASVPPGFKLMVTEQAQAGLSSYLTPASRKLKTKILAASTHLNEASD